MNKKHICIYNKYILMKNKISATQKNNGVLFVCVCFTWTQYEHEV